MHVYMWTKHNIYLFLYTVLLKAIFISAGSQISILVERIRGQDGSDPAVLLVLCLWNFGFSALPASTSDPINLLLLEEYNSLNIKNYFKLCCTDVMYLLYSHHKVASYTINKIILTFCDLLWLSTALPGWVHSHRSIIITNLDHFQLHLRLFTFQMSVMVQLQLILFPPKIIRRENHKCHWVLFI